MFQWLQFRRYKLYALMLEQGCYYVGLTARSDVRRRFIEHVNGIGAAWCRAHKPITIIEVRTLGWCPKFLAERAENRMTREYMVRYGLYRVRGGDLCAVNKKKLTRLVFGLEKTKRPEYIS